MALVPADGIDSRVLPVRSLQQTSVQLRTWIDQDGQADEASQLSFAYSEICRRQLPPLEEQRRIAEILDTIDETIQATERVIAKLTVA